MEIGKKGEIIEGVGGSGHRTAEHEREHGSLTEALKATDESFVGFLKEGNYAGAGEVLASRALTLRHLARQTKERSFLVLAESELEAAIKILEEKGQNGQVVFYTLAQVREDLGALGDSGMYKEAVESYRAAVDLITDSPAEGHDHPAEAANYRLHLAVCEYKMGDKTASGRAGKALRELEEVRYPDKYTSDVWLSGGHMKIADAMCMDDPVRAIKHLEFAKAIINSNPQLVLRREQHEELTKKIGA